MSDCRFITLREWRGQNTRRQLFARRFRFTLGRACSLWRKTPGYLDGAFERRRSAEAHAAERALLRLDERTLRDIGVKRCDLLAMACGLSRDQVVFQDRDGRASISRGALVEMTACPSLQRHADAGSQHYARPQQEPRSRTMTFTASNTPNARRLGTLFLGAAISAASFMTAPQAVTAGQPQLASTASPATNIMKWGSPTSAVRPWGSKSLSTGGGTRPALSCFPNQSRNSIGVLELTARP
jgi:uncharacterized protein YjiS (DUF1127 family)